MLAAAEPAQAKPWDRTGLILPVQRCPQSCGCQPLINWMAEKHAAEFWHA